MTLNIKNSEVHTLAAELARLRKVSLTTAVLEAVRHELENERRRQRKDGVAKDLVEIGKRCAKRLDHKISSADHGTLLYDDKGLPS
jgi:antitoxin VapB